MILLLPLDAGLRTPTWNLSFAPSSLLNNEHFVELTGNIVIIIEESTLVLAVSLPAEKQMRVSETYGKESPTLQRPAGLADSFLLVLKLRKKKKKGIKWDFQESEQPAERQDTIFMTQECLIRIVFMIFLSPGCLFAPRELSCNSPSLNAM